MIYSVATIVTIFPSNNATAVVLTPSLDAVMRKARVKNPPQDPKIIGIDNIEYGNRQTVLRKKAM